EGRREIPRDSAAAAARGGGVLAAHLRPGLPGAVLAGAIRRDAAPSRQSSPDVDERGKAARPGDLNRAALSVDTHQLLGGNMPITVQSPRGEAGVDSLYDTEEKVFEDIQANPGEKAFIFIHSVPFEGSVSLVNLLTSICLVRKGFDV